MSRDQFTIHTEEEETRDTIHTDEKRHAHYSYRGRGDTCSIHTEGEETRTPFIQNLEEGKLLQVQLIQLIDQLTNTMSVYKKNKTGKLSNAMSAHYLSKADT